LFAHYIIFVRGGKLETAIREQLQGVSTKLAIVKKAINAPDGLSDTEIDGLDTILSEIQETLNNLSG
jgi:hypothetical protein